VVVDEGAAGSPALPRAGEPRLLGHVLEAAVAAVAVETVLPPVRDVEVDVAVVVVVARARALPPAALDEADLVRDVDEAAVAAIPVEVTRRLRAARESLERRAVDEEDVLPADAVVVEQRDAAARRLQQVLVRLPAAIDGDRVEAGFFRHVPEREAERGLGIGRSGRFPPRRGEQEHEAACHENPRPRAHGRGASGAFRYGARRWAAANSACASAFPPVARSASPSW